MIDGVLQTPPKPQKHAFKLTKFRKQWLSHLGDVTVHTAQEIVELYKGSKRSLYNKALVEYLSTGCLKKHARVKTFLKAEKTVVNLQKDVPRLIQPRDKVYNIALGRYLRKNEKKMLGAIDKAFGYKTVLSGLDSSQVASRLWSNWKRFDNPVAFGIDASRFDQHCSVEALQWEHSFYLSAFGKRDVELQKLLSWQLNNDGMLTTDDNYCIHYRHKGGRMSGDVNTGLGNKIIMCGLMYEYLEELDMNTKTRLANNGDDCVLFCERADVDKLRVGLKKWFLHKGYTMTVENTCSIFEQIEFCRAKPVWTVRGYTMVRILNSVTRDAGTLLNVTNQKNMEAYLTAVGTCNGAINNGVALMSVVARRMRELGNNNRTIDLKNYFDYNMLERMGNKTEMDAPITEEARNSFYYAFGVTPQMQVDLEEYFSVVTNDAGPREVYSFIQPYSYLTPSHFAC